MRPLSDELRRVLSIFAALALVAGFLLFVLGEHTNRYFSWTIKPPLSAAFLGASFWAAFVLISWSARQRLWIRARSAMPPVFLIAVLLLVATLIHIDRFHLDSVFGWFWLVVYAIVPPALAFLLWRQLRAPGGDVLGRSPLPGMLRGVLALQATVMVVVGGALFIAPTGADSLWPWSLTPLTARALGAFVLGFGVSAADASRENDLKRFEGAALAYGVLGALELIAAARYADDFSGASLDTWIYVGFLASVLAVGFYGAARARARL
jgi:hypothetical protein